MRRRWRLPRLPSARLRISRICCFRSGYRSHRKICFLTDEDWMAEKRQPWTTGLTGYHWFVFLVASAAWFFDCLDQRLFTLARIPALTSLMPANTSIGEVQATGKEVTAIFLVGWGIG